MPLKMFQGTNLKLKKPSACKDGNAHTDALTTKRENRRPRKHLNAADVLINKVGPIRQKYILNSLIFSFQVITKAAFLFFRCRR